MVKTKTTPKTEYRRCPMCSEATKSEEDFKQHIMVCAMRTFQCSTCDYTNAGELNVKRHIKRAHPGLQPNDELIKLGPKDQSKKKTNDSPQNEKTTDENTDKEDWMNQDPGTHRWCPPVTRPVMMVPVMKMKTTSLLERRKSRTYKVARRTYWKAESLERKHSRLYLSPKREQARKRFLFQKSCLGWTEPSRLKYNHQHPLHTVN